MTTMTKEIYTALKSAGAPEDEAVAAAAAVPSKSDIATKSDLAELKEQMTWRMITVGGIYSAVIIAILKLIL